MINIYLEKIKELRLGKGKTQEDMAKIIGVSRPTYAAIETGRQKLDIEQAQKLVKEFNISLDSLMLGDIPDMEKYKHMILSYLRSGLSKDGKVTKTKLAKLLYLADFAWYYDNLKSMSGMPYRKIIHGPVPDMFFRAISELEESGKIEIYKKRFDEDKDVFLISESESNTNENITSLSKDQKDLIKKIAKKWKDKKTQEIVNFTHNQMPYSICRENEIIPYILITQEDPDKVY